LAEKLTRLWICNNDRLQRISRFAIVGPHRTSMLNFSYKFGAFLRLLSLLLLTAGLSLSVTRATELAMAQPELDAASHANQSHQSPLWIKPSLSNRRRLKGVTYFQNEWPYTFWDNLNLSQLDPDFKRIRACGFNTIVVVVSWGSFQPTIYPITYNESNFAKLIKLVEVARNNGLWVVLRAATPEHAPSDLKNGQRAYLQFDTLYDRTQTTAIGQLYGELSKRLRKYENVFGFFNSWEDFSSYFHVLDLPEKDRLTFEKRTSAFQKYAQSHGSLVHWNQIWGTHYASFNQIPVPAARTRALLDYFNFVTDQINQNVLAAIAANRVSQELGYELRIDQDQVKVDGKLTGYSYLDNLALPKEFSFVAAYYNPCWGASPGKYVKPEFTEIAIPRLLHEIFYAVGNRPIFFDQLNIADDTPEFVTNPKLPYPDGETISIKRVVPIIFKETVGYSLWTYKDYVGNIVQDGAFNGNDTVWQPKPKIVKSSGKNYLELGPSASIRQTVYCYFNPGNCTPVAWRANLKLENAANKPSVVEVEVHTAEKLSAHRSLNLAAREKKDLELEFSELKNCAPSMITLRANSSNSAPVKVYYVSLWNHLMATGLFDRFGVERASRINAYRRVIDDWLPVETGRAVPNAELTFLDTAKLQKKCVFYPDSTEIPLYLPFPAGSVSLDFNSATNSTLKAKWLTSTRSDEFSYRVCPGLNHVQIPCANALPGDNLLLLKLRADKPATLPVIAILKAGQNFAQPGLNKLFSGPAQFSIPTNTNRLFVEGSTGSPNGMQIWFAVGGHPPLKKDISGGATNWRVSLAIDSDLVKDKPFLYVYAEPKGGGSSTCQIKNIVGESQRGPNEFFK
jgi:hypothetical protein